MESEISVVIPTLNRTDDLSNLLSTLLNQDQPPLEVIVVDDSIEDSTASLTRKLAPNFEAIDSNLIYLRGDGSGNTSARNIGIEASRGDAVLFLDDDTLVEKNVIKGMSEFFRGNPAAVGVQPRISGFADYWAKSHFGLRLENLLDKVAMITYHEQNRLSVRRSGAAIYPSDLTKVISVQRMLGCCFCIRRPVLSKFRFDTNLKKWGCYDDLDLTYRIYRNNPGSLFAIPNVNVVHKHSNESRLPARPLHKMTTIYWFYVFFKDLADESPLNTIAFIWAMFGFLFWTMMAAFTNRDGQRLQIIRYLARDYAESLWHLKSIRSGRLEFFNRTL